MTTRADILSVGQLRPAGAPVSRPAPKAVAQGEWTAYRLDEATDAILNPPERLKRLGRGQSMALEVVRRALAACAEPPEKGRGTAVSLGTSLAEEGDDILFLQKIIEFGEKGAKPAYFVNSVKNALASQLALNNGWQGENQTFAHDALSFETALWQGARLLCAGRARHAVVCGVDALIEFQEIHGHVAGHYRSDPKPIEPLAGFPRPCAQGPKGTVVGEGAAAFVLAAENSSPKRQARLLGVRSGGAVTRYPKLIVADELAYVKDAAAQMGVDLGSVGLVLMGANDDALLDPIYAGVFAGLKSAAPKAGLGVYKHLTGEFATASALGFALAVRAVAEKAIPAEIRQITPGSAGTVLLYHLTTTGYHSVMAVSG
ncbi:MAG TPA: beta-ketoacyl synthase N-terminal-like domain-containing protein [Myxococcales bacterium]